MSLNKGSRWLLLLAAVSSVGLSAVAPVYAEQKQEVLYNVTDLDGRDYAIRAEERRAQSIFNDYIDKMQVVEKVDNDVRFLINQSSRYTDKSLQDYLNNEVIPRSSELLSLANGITSRSTAIQDLHDEYVAYVTERHNAMVFVAAYADKRIPAQEVNSYFSHSGEFASESGGSSSYTAEHKSDEAYSIPAAMRTIMASADSIRRDYFNQREYIQRNQVEVLKHEK